MNTQIENHSVTRWIEDYAAPVGRVLLALLFINAGYGKITGYTGTAGYMDAMGVPSILLPLVILLELGGGIALLLGYQTRFVSLLLAGFTLLAGILFHYLPAAGMEGMEAQNQMIHFMKNIAIAGGLLLLLGNGAGGLSLDARLGKA